MKKVRTIVLLAALIMTLCAGSALADWGEVYFTCADGTKVKFVVEYDPMIPGSLWSAGHLAAVEAGLVAEDGSYIDTPELGDGGASLALLSGAAALSAAGFAFSRRKARNAE